MRILLVALNAKYIHTNLALRYLREDICTEYSNVLIKEFSINDNLDRIAGEIFEAKADVVGFSCYIWNLKETMAVIRRLHPICPNVRFVLGGPEVSFEAEEFLTEHSEVDALVIGEGEKIFLELLKAWQKNIDPSHVPGVAWRRGDRIMLNSSQVKPLSLNDLPFPYAKDEDFTGRLVYVETTRGCPFNCQYCLSSTFQGVRFLEPENFRRMFRQLLKNGARTVKFVDRTFNANKRHALKILDIVREESAVFTDAEEIRVHCEMAGDLFDAEWVDYFRNYPRGLVQLEIGVQSTHEPTLKIVSRPQAFEDWKKYIIEMKSIGIPLHLDLIAGLPAENWRDFRTSFNDVYKVEPDMLQLGFLKVLKGSGLRQKSGSYGLLFMPDPPYTILETAVLSHNELLQLHRLESILDKYYNSGKFRYTLREVLKLFPTPFDFYHEFAEFWHKQEWFCRQWQGKALFDKLWEFLHGKLEVGVKDGIDSIPWPKIRDSLKFDFYLWERPSVIPDYLQDEDTLEMEKTDRWKRMQETIRKDPCWEPIIPEVKEMDRRQWNRNTAVVHFTSDLQRNDEDAVESCWYLFYYQHGKATACRYEGS